MDCTTVKGLLSPFASILQCMRVIWLSLEEFLAHIKRTTRLPKLEDDDIEAAQTPILQHTLFGNSLQETMDLQASRWPNRQLPWVQVELTQQILRLNGLVTEGIFRVSTSPDYIRILKFQMETWQVGDPYDVHVSANLLKRWLRELPEPLIPFSLYSECVTEPITPQRACNVALNLPTINRFVLCYLVRLLQTFSKPDIIQYTKMDAYNLAMIFAPNCLRSNDPSTELSNVGKEIAFMKCLIEELDTECVNNMI